MKSIYFLEFYPVNPGLDKDGITSATTHAALEAVKGKDSSGAKIDREGKELIVVRHPGSTKLFKVSAGHFIHYKSDLIFQDDAQPVLRLERYFHSEHVNGASSPSGWSFTPYILKFGRSDNRSIPAPRKCRLVDLRSGTVVDYELLDNRIKTDSAKQSRSAYAPKKRGPHPQLVRDGTKFIVTFAHGVRAVFDRSGRLESIKRERSDPIVYHYSNSGLKSISRGDAKIDLLYDGVRLVKGRRSDGQHVTYEPDSHGRIGRVITLNSPTWVFEYDQSGLVSRISSQQQEQQTLMVANEYDSDGRMTLQRTKVGEWRFKYNDMTGQAMVTDPSGSQTICYYPGLTG